MLENMHLKEYPAQCINFFPSVTKVWSLKENKTTLSFNLDK